jgi:hypothetical protein
VTCYVTVINVGSVMTGIGRDADDCLVNGTLENTLKITADVQPIASRGLVPAEKRTCPINVGNVR